MDVSEIGKVKSRSISPGKYAKEKERVRSWVLKKEGKVCVKQARELFGDEDAQDNLPRSTSCVCLSPVASCYILPKHVRSTQDFIKRILNPGTLTFLNERRKVQDWWIRQRLTSMKNAEFLKLKPPENERKAESQSPTRHESSITQIRSLRPKPSPKEKNNTTIFLTTTEVLNQTLDTESESPKNRTMYPSEPPLSVINNPIKISIDLPSPTPRKSSLPPRNFCSSPKAAASTKSGNRESIVKDYNSEDQSPSPELRRMSPVPEVPLMFPKILRRSRHHMFRLKHTN